MQRSVVLAQYKASLLDAVDKFTAPLDADFSRHLDVALPALARKRARTVKGSLALVARLGEYAAPADLLAVKFSTWGDEFKSGRGQWDPLYPKNLPKLGLVEVDGTRMLRLDPAPTSGQIELYGSSCVYFYYGNYTLSETASETTVRAEDIGLLFLRAQAEAMKELAFRGVGKPVQLRDGMTAGLRNAHPAALYDQLMKAFAEAA